MYLNQRLEIRGSIIIDKKLGQTIAQDPDAYYSLPYEKIVLGVIHHIKSNMKNLDKDTIDVINYIHPGVVIAHINEYIREYGTHDIESYKEHIPAEHVDYFIDSLVALINKYIDKHIEINDNVIIFKPANRPITKPALEHARKIILNKWTSPYFSNEYICSRGPASPYYYYPFQLYELKKMVGESVFNDLMLVDERSRIEYINGGKQLHALGYDLKNVDSEWFKRQTYNIINLPDEIKDFVTKKYQKFDQKAFSRAKTINHITKILGVTQNKDKIEREIEEIEQDLKELDKIHTRMDAAFWYSKKFRGIKKEEKVPEFKKRIKASLETELKNLKNHSQILEWFDIHLRQTNVLNDFSADIASLIVRLNKIGVKPDNTQKEFPPRLRKRQMGINLVSILELFKQFGNKARALKLIDSDNIENLLNKANGLTDSEFESLLFDNLPPELGISNSEFNYILASNAFIGGILGVRKFFSRPIQNQKEATVYAILATYNPHLLRSTYDPRLLRFPQKEEETKGPSFDFLFDRHLNDIIKEFGIDFSIKFLANVLHEDVPQMRNDMHDATYWIEHWEPSALPKSEMISLLLTLREVDDARELSRIIGSYDIKDDPLRKERGEIQSIRELKTRVIAITENFDPKTCLWAEDIIMAPGINFSAIKNFNTAKEFKELLNGDLDKNQPFEPFVKEFPEEPLNVLISKGLGSRKQKIKGEAENPSKLFKQLKDLIGGFWIDDQNHITEIKTDISRKLTVLDLLKSVPQSIEADVLKLLETHGVISNKYKAQIHSKSDPKGWVAGNYTDCCMPFGSSINNDYMFNPGTQYFTISFNDRIIAQSIVVDAKDHEGNDVIILDNIEVANNYTKHNPNLSYIYQVFWTIYTTKPVKIGAGNSDLIPSNCTVSKNHYRPKQALTYSDARDVVYNLPKSSNLMPINDMITYSNVGIRDQEIIKELEQQIYPDSMVEQYGDEILAIDPEIPGSLRSFLINKGKQPVGYILMKPEQSETSKNDMVLHVWDMGILPSYRGDLRLLKMITEKILGSASEHRGAIELEAREKTTYKLLKARLVQRWLEDAGFKKTIEEKKPKYIGDEDFYFMRYDFDENMLNEDYFIDDIGGNVLFENYFYE